ncbi:hypothetical protein [Halomonas sp. C22]|uniref:hypothetical protein n=1 Tax=Halomonas sp. C22 TaxID=2580567 RepID=UPI0011A6478F|nr:hypothetical protein [Halomonas sp. C22]
MKEIIELASAISVLFASLAGVLAINKWRVERLDKAKIDAFEAYESAVEKLSEKVDFFYGGVGFKEANINSDSLKSVIDAYYDIRSAELLKIKSQLGEAGKCVDKYSMFAGDALHFNFRYHYSVVMEMERSLFLFCSFLVNKAELEEEKEDFYVLVSRFSKGKDYGSNDLIDSLMMVDHSMEAIAASYASGNRVEIYRREVNLYMEKILRVEKRMLYSSFPIKIFLKVKFFFLKCRIVGRKWLLLKDEAWVVTESGELCLFERMKGKKRWIRVLLVKIKFISRMVKRDMVEFFC